VVPPVTPSLGTSDNASLRTRPRRRLPLPPLAPLRQATIVYGLATVDCHGRVADRTVMQALSWPPGTRLNIHGDGHDQILVTADPTGTTRVTSHGHLRLPAAVQRAYSVTIGDRVLLAADPDRSVLVLLPPTALDAMITEPDAGKDGDRP
jgi:bifunctional DNA-binding transcriptional regulator/antitoxin component of YhaV-PrlF toxin-antitoxin module